MCVAWAESLEIESSIQSDGTFFCVEAVYEKIQLMKIQFLLVSTYELTKKVFTCITYFHKFENKAIQKGLK